MILRLSSFLIVSVLTVPVTSVNGEELGNIAFVGDSITQGFDSSIYSSSPQASFRYNVWKGLIDNGLNYGEDYTFVGSQIGSSYKGSADTIGSATPDYCGQSFNNIHEGHFNWNASYISGTQTASGANLTQNRGSGTLSEWLRGYTADTVFIMLGTNDLNNNRTTEQLVSDIGTIVQAYQKDNANTRIYVMGITPSSSSAGSAIRDKIVSANAALQTQVSSWTTGTSKVSYLDAGQGMANISNGYGVMNIDKWHPNKQGELILAGNVLKALGMQGQSAGMERKAFSSLEHQIGSFNNSELSWSANGGNFTVEFNLNADWDNSSSDTFTVQLGNGSAENGLLQITSTAISWDGSILYNLDTSDVLLNLRIAYTEGDTTTNAGYYVWLDDQLIGQELSGSLNAVDSLQMNADNQSFVITDLAYDTGGAFATLSIPEPSTVTLSLFGVASLLLRRKR